MKRLIYILTFRKKWCRMFHVISVKLNDQGAQALFLVSESNRNFLSGWAKGKRTKAVAKNFTTLLLLIEKHGFGWALNSGKLICVDGDLGLFEMRSFSGVWRVACYFHSESWQMVMLKEFRGHQGSNRIPPGVLKDCKTLAREAKSAMERRL